MKHFLLVVFALLVCPATAVALLIDCAGSMPLMENERRSGYARGESSRWFPASGGPARAAVLMIHGLNQKPSKLQALIDVLNTRRMHVFRLTLQGHGGASFDDMKAVDAGKWRANFRSGYCELERRFPRLRKVLVAYSLGALVAQEYQLRAGTALFDRQLLLAPALRPQPYVTLIKPLTHLLPRIPSRTPEAYRANPGGTASAAYRAMFTLWDSFHNQSDCRVLNVDTLVLMHPEDEVVSYRGIEAVIKEKKLDAWKLRPIALHQSRLTPDFKHLMIDEDSLGPAGWGDTIAVITGFLNER